MFTGIVTAIGTVASVEQDKDWRFVIDTPWACETIDLGASICCSGVCLTVTQRDTHSFTVEVSEETLSCTTVGHWQVGTAINLERALKMGDELGGHVVSGHVDGLAVIEKVTPVAGSHKLDISVPSSLAGYIAEKGSVALDGVSLTVNTVDDNHFSVNIIDHTWQNTTLGQCGEQDKLNLEIDMLARYVSRLLQVSGEHK